MQTSLGILDYPADGGSGITGTRYDAAADSWDETVRRLGFADAYRSVLVTALTPLQQPTSVRVLDVGIGTGEHSIALARALRSRGMCDLSVYGVDVSKRMLEIATEKLAEEQVGFQGVLADGQDLPMPSASFDVVSAAHVIEHARSPLKFMSEMERVLRPGGIMVTMMTRCNPVTRSIQKRWQVQCARSRKLEAVLRDFGMVDVKVLPYPGSLVCNLLSFCCVANKPWRLS